MRDYDLYKEELEKEIRILGNSLDMYEKTLAEMRLRKEGTFVDTESVEDIRKDVKAQLDEAESILSRPWDPEFIEKARNHFIAWQVKTFPKNVYNEEGAKKAMKSRFTPNAIEEMGVKYFYNMDPYFRHRWVLSFDDMDIPYYCIGKVEYKDGWLNVLFRDCTEFYTPEFFDNYSNKTAGTVAKVYLLSPYGSKKAVAEFTGVKFVKYEVEPLDYAEDNPLNTLVRFKYKKVTHKRLNATGKKRKNGNATKKKEGTQKGETASKVRDFKVGG